MSTQTQIFQYFTALLVPLLHLSGFLSRTATLLPTYATPPRRLSSKAD